MAAGSAVVKRSLLIAGHRTSVSLEDAFWVALKDIAVRRGVSAGQLAAEIDRGRGTANLSSAIRVFVLDAVLSASQDTAGLPAAAPLPPVETVSSR